MRIIFLLIATVLYSKGFSQNKDSIVLRNIFNESLSNGKSYEMLTDLCVNIGPRLSGSENAAKAVKWAEARMKEFGFDKVYLQEVMVPHWVRGEKEIAYIEIKGKKIAVDVCALGGSVGTNGRLSAKIIEVKSFDELKTLGEKEIKGKYVFYNRPMDPTKINSFEAYGPAVSQRGSGANEAVKFGAIGVIVRSINNYIDDYPHTGAMRAYDANYPKIPACAISTLDAEFLSNELQSNKNITFNLTMNCNTLPDTLSYNVIGEIRGTDFPDEIIAFGGHLDSWDLGQGAHDDGAGCIETLEALRLIKKLNLRPKRTLRCVLFMNEENGLKGGIEYAKQAKLNGEKHLAALESDEGGFTPRGFGFDMDKERFKKVEQWKPLFAPYHLLDFHLGGGGADIGPLKEQGVVLMNLFPDPQRYFQFHHSALDVIEGVNKRELELGSAAIAGIVYMISEYGL